MSEKRDRARKRAERESRKYERRGRFIFFGALVVLLAVAAVIGVLVYRVIDKDSPPGLIIEDLKIGEGPEAREGNAVSVDYAVYSENGTQIAATGLGVPLTFTLGKEDNGVIDFLDQGIVGMKEGGKRRLTVPPNLGYGDQAFSDLPANSTITCEVALLAVR